MKQGWIQTDTNGTKEDFAPKSMAELVYMNSEKTETVKEVLQSIRTNPEFDTVTANRVIGAVYQ